MNSSDFATLCGRAWSLPVLAELVGTAGGRASPIAHALGASRAMVGQTFLHLDGLGLVVRTPGHGHPLRPEFSLTPRGEAVAEWAREFLLGLTLEERDVARRAWALPTLRLVSSPQRFGELRTQLEPVTDRALALCLRRLASNALVLRDVDVDRRPPRVSYVADGRGTQLSAALQPTCALRF